MQVEILKAFFITVVLGFIIGLERSVSFTQENEEGFAGSRTFTLIALYGFISAYINNFVNYFLLFSFSIFGLLVIIAYFLKVYHYSKQGTTTHIAALITYLIGVMVYFNQTHYAIFITVLTVVVLNLKTKLKKIEDNLTQKELNAGVLLLIMTFIMLPILPNKAIGPFELFNPYKTWLMAIIIASLSFIGYLGIKFFGEKKGILFTAAAGGFISSTAVTASLSAMFKETKTSVFTYASAIAIANTLMFARVLIEVYITNIEIVKYIGIVYLFAFIYGVWFSYYFYKKSKENIQTTLSKLEKNPLELSEAIKFAIIFAIIYALVEYTNKHFGNLGLYIVSFISGFTDVDAITLSLGELSKTTLSLKNAAIGIVTASISNTLTKFFIVMFFSKELAKKTLIFFIPEILILSLSFLFILWL
ncbi:putative membrane protein [Nautilia profundicola AmH]|uniref:Membrane protein n=1 Tax=Nautilia profundicola (strain ATCC BAA-1463 / DSM 18972 / AmH) TaxID=598659 RepID=B9L5K1_NAUPA|nr:MgtC/SapB family protein [Nautilia profundicola]ACM92887.1 putative membrane protein [Nautilia profundicola AmH]